VIRMVAHALLYLPVFLPKRTPNEDRITRSATIADDSEMKRTVVAGVRVFCNAQNQVGIRLVVE
jgi:hypothetical protein